MKDDIATAIHILDKLGVTLDDLNATGGPRTVTTPTFGDYISQLRTSLPASTVGSYDSYWRIVERTWSSRHLDEPTPLEIEEMINNHRARAVVRANSRDGRAAATNLFSAIRCIYRNAERDDLVHPNRNPAKKVQRPPRLDSPRHALSLTQVMQLAEVASTTGNDPELDALIVRVHIETACRRGGVLRLEITDLDATDCLIRLREKGGSVRWQPISPSLTAHLIAHARSRGGPETTELLRYRSGRPLTSRRFDSLMGRVRKHLPWAAALQVSIHWIRHTTLTWVERECGYAVARAFAGHATPTIGTGVTLTYVRAGLPEVARALALLTGEPHPLAEETDTLASPPTRHRWGAAV